MIFFFSSDPLAPFSAKTAVVDWVAARLLLRLVGAKAVATGTMIVRAVKKNFILLVVGGEIMTELYVVELFARQRFYERNRMMGILFGYA